MKIISSFSGGKTSAYMTIKLKEKYPDLIVLFANTGQENDETLDFVNKCDIEYKLNVVWIESKVYHNERKGSGYNITNYKAADRKGKVFEEMIKKYGIPNKSYIHCTRELKLEPIKNWIREYVKCDYKMAVGIRLDEQDRMSKKADRDKLFYPLVDWKIIKEEINEFWRGQSFNLNLPDYKGNCKTCFKKSNRKLLMIAKENPEVFDFAIRMEEKHGLAGHNIDGTKRVFFRDNTSALELLKMNDTTQMDFLDFIDKIDEDEDSGCSESCEAFTS